MYLVISISLFLDSFFSMLLGLKFLSNGGNIDVPFGALSVVMVIKTVHFEKL